jgi:hypothetical protein
MRKPPPSHQQMTASGLKVLRHPIAHTFQSASLLQHEVGKAEPTPTEKAPKPTVAQALFPNLPSAK